MKIDLVPINSIKPYEKNPRKNEGAVDIVVRSIEEFGFRQPIVVDKNNIVIVGHTRLKAAQKLGILEVPVHVAENLTEQQAKAYRLADNRTNEDALWDLDLLIGELKELDDPTLSMFSNEELDELLLVDEPDDDKIPDAPEVIISKEGDLWLLGDHKIFCGDSVAAESYNRLLENEKINLCFSSPPYNIAGGMYANNDDNKSSQEFIQFNMDVLTQVKNHLSGFIFWNISYNLNSRFEFIEITHKIVNELNLKFLELIVWHKGKSMPIRSSKLLKRDYEDVFLYGDEDSVQHDMELWVISKNHKAWFNKKHNTKVTNYWKIDNSHAQLDNHKACFPVELPLKGIKLMTGTGDIVCDPFLGSGTTMIACEKSGRKCRGIELDPTYVDIAIIRWQQITGKKAINAATGKEWGE